MLIFSSVQHLEGIFHFRMYTHTASRQTPGIWCVMRSTARPQMIVDLCEATWFCANANVSRKSIYFDWELRARFGDWRGKFNVKWKLRRYDFRWLSGVRGETNSVDCIVNGIQTICSLNIQRNVNTKIEFVRFKILYKYCQTQIIFVYQI